MTINEATIAHLLINPKVVDRFAAIAAQLAEEMLAVILPVNTLAKKKKYNMLMQWQDPSFRQNPLLFALIAQALGLFYGENFDYKDLYDWRFVAQARPMIDEAVNVVSGVQPVDDDIPVDPQTLELINVGENVPASLPMQMIYYQVDSHGATQKILMGGVNNEVIEIGVA